VCLARARVASRTDDVNIGNGSVLNSRPPVVLALGARQKEPGAEPGPLACWGYAADFFPSSLESGPGLPISILRGRSASGSSRAKSI
jgi:hypothetical protein